MTQDGCENRRVAELNALLSNLDDHGREQALAIVQSLGLVQSALECVRGAPKPFDPAQRLENK